MDNESEPPCWKTDERCALRAIELYASNLMAWNIYQSARSRVGHVLMELEPIELSPAEASDIAEKMRIIDSIMTEWENEKQQKAEADAWSKTHR